MKLYAIGDIHGCLDALTKMLAKIEKDRDGEKAKVVFLGDYTDRGPDSYGVVQLLDDLRTHPQWHPDVVYVFIRGNHDVMFLDWIGLREDGATFMYNGGQETENSYRAVGARLEDHKAFMGATQWMHRHGEFLFVHAGVDPTTSIEDQSNDTLVWSRHYNEWDGEFPENVFVVHGHTPVKNVDIHKNQVNVDTGCVFRYRGYDEYNGLTCVRLDSRNDIKFIQTREKH